MNRHFSETPSQTWIGLRSTLFIGLVIMTSCNGGSEKPPSNDQTDATHPLQETDADANSGARERMVASQLAARDIRNRRVLDTMRRVPRHQFVPADLQQIAYSDSPLPIGSGQTISQPYIVALMTQLVDPKPNHRALDVGTGSGYQAAVLAELVKDVFSIEIVDSLAVDAHKRLQSLGHNNVTIRSGDGYAGWKTEAPFDVIIVAAAPDHVPPALVEQLARGGKMVIPIGDRSQSLILIEKKMDGSISRRNVAPVRFVPMTGEAER